MFAFCTPRGGVQDELSSSAATDMVAPNRAMRVLGLAHTLGHPATVSGPEVKLSVCTSRISAGHQQNKEHDRPAPLWDPALNQNQEKRGSRHITGLCLPAAVSKAYPRTSCSTVQ